MALGELHRLGEIALGEREVHLLHFRMAEQA